MELNLDRSSVGMLETFLDTVSEQPVDVDFTLPDYCPDIEKILRCKLTPKIYNRNISGGQLQVDGATVVTVLYTEAQNNTIRVCEQTIPFNASFQLKNVPEINVTETSVKCEYVNCRALSKRRLTVHGAFSLCVKILGKGSVDLCSPVNTDDYEFLTNDINCSALTTLSQDVFSAGDELRITNKPPVELILDSSLKANVTDVKIIPERIMLSGELNVRLLYLSSLDSKSPNQIDCLIPFSKIIDCEGISDECTTCVSVSVLSYEIRLKNDILSDDAVVDVDSRICATVSGYKDISVPVAVDAYSTKFVTSLTKERVTVPTQLSVISDSFMHKETVSLGDAPIGEIIDLQCDYRELSPVIGDDSVTINSKLNIYILALNKDGDPVYIERSFEFPYEERTDVKVNDIANLYANVISLSFRLGDNNSVELRAEIKLCLTLCEKISENMVTAVSSDDASPVNKKQCALSLYYAGEGEKIWDIARKFYSRSSLIKEENSLFDDVLTEPGMLLIPIVNNGG